MAEDIDRRFLDDLQDLLRKYGAEITAADDGKPYGMAQPIIEIEFSDPYKCVQIKSVDACGVARVG